jgi:hypothetical protein
MNLVLWAGAILLLAVAVVGLATAARLWALDLSGDKSTAALLGGQWHLESWLKVTGAAIGLMVVSIALGRRLEFVNLSSHHQLYSARLTRAYLGASNPRRKESNNWQLTETVTGDQMEYGDFSTCASVIGGTVRFRPTSARAWPVSPPCRSW